MTAVKQSRLSNIILIIIVLLLLAMIVLQVWHMIDSTRPVIRPGLTPKKVPTQRSPLYERFHNPEAMNCNQLTITDL